MIDPEEQKPWFDQFKDDVRQIIKEERMDTIVPSAAEALAAIENELDTVKTFMSQLAGFDGARRARILKLVVELSGELP